jgi:hypothetical protein
MCPSTQQILDRIQVKTSILSHASVTKDKVRIGNWIYYTGTIKVSLNYTPNIDVLQHMWRHTLRLLILLLATPLFPWNFGTQVKSIPIPIFSHILSARTTHKKAIPSIVAWLRPQRKHVPRIRLWVDWSVSSAGRGADDTKNTVSYIVACWTVFIELLPGKTLIKSILIGTSHVYYLHIHLC